MAIAQVLDALEYTESPHFLRYDEDALDRIPDFGHIFRKAHEECQLQGVYVLRSDPADTQSTLVPVVYVCEAETDEQADQFHRLIWNQNIVPFILVTTPSTVRLYAGFRHAVSGKPAQCGILDAAIAFNDVASRLSAFQSTAIDDGTLWREWGKHVTPETRVDWKLLDNLKTLDLWLLRHGLDRTTAHALIGKFVYLRYLRDRDILSDRKLARWEIAPKNVFSRQATLQSFRLLMARLDDWLNGSVFPIDVVRADWITDGHIAYLAQAFLGDNLETGQLHLDFTAYDFSCIPIETLSVIYEQFLHTSDEEEAPTRGKEVGAYYTPIPLVNFMLSELDDQHPLREGMRVLDPSCGSGAFLVQCYRRLIERQRMQNERGTLLPSELRRLLENHIYGVDSDADACRVAELSLILTLLDYVTPPDLEHNPRFKLPSLHNRNIFEADFFNPNSAWAHASDSLTFDWIVGNPPWKELSSQQVSAEDTILRDWILEHKDTHPTGGNQIAEAFTWRVLTHVTPDGVVGFLVPAMTLFKDSSQGFRAAFFKQTRVWAVANFANLAEVLFAGRARRPAAALFYRPRIGPDSQELRVQSPEETADVTDERILHYAPLVVNLPTQCIGQTRRRQEIWNLTINASDVREVSTAQAVTGNMLPWKLAMWGSHYDGFLLQKIKHRYPTLAEFAQQHHLLVHEGFQLRRGAEGAEPTEHVHELIGKLLLDFKRLRHCGRIFTLPSDALDSIPEALANVRKRGGVAVPLSVCRPPHLIVDAARRFAVYSDKFIVIPPRQIGIASSAEQADLLCALALYLNADFVRYHQFLLSPQWGIDTNISTLSTLLQLPIPLGELDTNTLQHWASLYQRCVALDEQLQEASDGDLLLFDDETLHQQRARLLQQINTLVNDWLGLNMQERMLVRDMVYIKIPLTQGKVSIEASRTPTQDELLAYASTLQQELDIFVQDQSSLCHAVTVIYDRTAAMIQIALRAGTDQPVAPTVLPADHETSREFGRMRQHLRVQRSQWVYFERNLRIYDATTTYLFKPLQRLLWTQSQALLDAGDVIADILTGTEA